MIIPDEIKPDYSFYVIGAQIIQFFNSEPLGVFDVYILYDKFTEKFGEKVSLNYFLYAIDWLFLLNLVSFYDNNEIKRCF